MGRGFRTSAANPLDYMYKLNVPLMERVIARNDEYITQNLNTLTQDATLANSITHGSWDDERVKQISDTYSKQIDELTNMIKKDPANWRKKVDDVRNITSKLSTDYRTGEISKIVGNYQAYQTFNEGMNKMVEEYGKGNKGIDANTAAAYRNYYVQKFLEKSPKGTAYNPATGEYNTFTAQGPMAEIDIRKELSEGLDKIKEDEHTEVSEELIANGAYFNETTKKWSGVSDAKILSIASARLLDPRLQSYLRERSQVGLMSGIFDKDGKFVNPYDMKNVGLSEEETRAIETAQDKIDKIKNPADRKKHQDDLDAYKTRLEARKALSWNNATPLAPMLQGIVQQFSSSKTEEKNNLSNNSLYNTQLTIAAANQRAAADRNSREALAREKERGVNDRFAATLGLQREQFEWNKEHPKGGKTGTGTGTGGTKDKTEKPPDTTGVDRVETRNFKEKVSDIKDPEKKVFEYSTAGLSSDIVRYREQLKAKSDQLKQVNAALAGYKAVPSMLNAAAYTAYQDLVRKKEQLDRDITSTQATLTHKRELYKKVDEAVLTNHDSTKTPGDKDLSNEEITAYQYFRTNDPDGSKTRNNLTALRKRYNDLFHKTTGTKSMGGDDNPVYTQRLIAQQKTRNTPGDKPREKTKESIEMEKISAQIAAEQRRLDTYIKVKPTVDRRRENFLSSVRENVMASDAIVPNVQENRFLSDMVINTKPLGMTLRNADGTKSTGKAGEYSLTFTGEKNFADYLRETGSTIKVDRVGVATFGSGNVAMKITITDDKGGKVGTGKSFFIETTPAMQREIANRFKKHSNPDVARIGGMLGDDDYMSMMNQLKNPDIRDVGVDQNMTKTIYAPSATGERAPIKITYLEDDKISAIGYLADGTEFLVPNPNGINGIFNGVNDFTNLYMQGVNAAKQVIARQKRK